MSDVVERLEDLRIFIRDNDYVSHSTKRTSVELFAAELLMDIDDAVSEITRLTAEVKEATEARDHYRSETERLMKCFGTIDRQGADIAHLTAEVKRLRTVVDAALEWYETDTNDRDATKRLFRQIEKYRALDGEPCPTCNGRGSWYEVGSGEPIEACHSCGGTGRKQ